MTISPEFRQALDTIAKQPQAEGDYVSAIWRDLNQLIEFCIAIKRELDRDLAISQSSPKRQPHSG